MTQSGTAAGSSVTVNQTGAVTISGSDFHDGRRKRRDQPDVVGAADGQCLGERRRVG